MVFTMTTKLPKLFYLDDCVEAPANHREAFLAFEERVDDRKYTDPKFQAYLEGSKLLKKPEPNWEYVPRFKTRW